MEWLKILKTLAPLFLKLLEWFGKQPPEKQQQLLGQAESAVEAFTKE